MEKAPFAGGMGAREGYITSSGWEAANCENKSREPEEKP
jgi:hypothetical protein